ncbi:NAD(+) diphosphatase [Intrasporangium calvum]|uniref:NAD(+) diphosphatase n=1 Tax=Intrasporangium calvum TaxID=53358 RepID=A0ABT5GL65_9MICO|nr:NAD(+) diphosphatase [Intrasporangium calvum]MDC5698959.1 NAD(+) diphosphatase [Intrasporangium calvum]
MARSADQLPDVALSGAALDRSANERRDERLLERLLADPGTRVLELRGDRAPVVAVGPAQDGTSRLRLRPPSVDDARGVMIFAGRDAEGVAYLGVAHPPEGTADAGARGPVPPEREGWLTLRQAAAGLDERDAALFVTVLGLANWHASHTHCSRCGAQTAPTQGGWLRVCPADGSEHYPRTDPAVIMAVVDDADRLLLGRGPQWPEGRFSVLAGFVEPGESFEAAVAREVAEEVGLQVTDVRYLGNQPWPFPSSVMVGFTARALGTDIEPDPQEVSEARWFSRDDYRAALRSGEILAPFGISIAKRIIEHWLGETIESAVGLRR